MQRLADELAAEPLCARVGETVPPFEITVEGGKGYSMEARVEMAVTPEDVQVAAKPQPPIVHRGVQAADPQGGRRVQHAWGGRGSAPAGGVVLAARFGAYEDAEAFCQRFFPWYNAKHRHGALGLMTPHDIHHGLAAPKWQQRAEIPVRRLPRAPRALPARGASPPAAADGGLDQQTLGGAGARCARGILRPRAQRDRLRDLAAVTVLRRSAYPEAEL
jgi:hypothetical protein